MRPLTRPLPRRGLRIRRPRPSRVLAAAAVLVAVALAETGPVRRDSAATTSPVWIAAIDLEPGDVIAADDVGIVEAPTDLVPAAASGPDPSGRVVRSRIGAGEVMSEHRLAGPGAAGTSALLGPEQRGVAVPRSGVDVGLAIGDHVDVLATLEPDVERADPTVVLAERVMVIATDDDTVTVAVDRFEATTLAHAVVTATVTLTLAP